MGGYACFAACAAAGLKCELVEVAWDGIIPALQEKKIDVIWSSMTITDKRKEVIDFTQFYYDAPTVEIGPKSDDTKIDFNNADSVKGKIFGVQTATIHADYVQKYFGSAAEVKLYDTLDNALADLKSGRLDFVQEGRTSLTPFLSSNPDFAELAICPQDPLLGYGVGGGVRKVEDVRRLVGGWKTETTWKMTGAIRDGDGRPYRNRGWWFPRALLPDFSSPQVRRWWTDRARRVASAASKRRSYCGRHARLRSERYAPPRYRDGETFGEPHGFFLTVPGVRNDIRVLEYQQKFIDKVLDHALAYDHILYCVTNEIHEPHPLAWSSYWADYVRRRARQSGRRVYVTEMFWVFDFSHRQHRPALEDPQTFDYFEASQNSAISSQILGLARVSPLSDPSGK